MSQRLSALKGLGPKSEQDLIEVGIASADDLKRIGPIPAFLKLKAQHPKVSINFLYALVGAVKGEHWLKIARDEKSHLLSQLEGYDALQKVLEDEGLLKNLLI